jgi:integrase
MEDLNDFPITDFVSPITNLYAPKIEKTSLEVEQLEQIVDQLTLVQDVRSLGTLAILWHTFIRPEASCLLKFTRDALIPIEMPKRLTNIEKIFHLDSNVQFVLIKGMLFAAIIVRKDKTLGHRNRLCLVPPKWHPTIKFKSSPAKDLHTHLGTLGSNGFILAEAKSPWKRLNSFQNLNTTMNEILEMNTISAYSLRHGATQTLFDEDMDTSAVQAITGHRAPESVEHYIKNTPKALFKFFRF